MAATLSHMIFMKYKWYFIVMICCSVFSWSSLHSTSMGLNTKSLTRAITVCLLFLFTVFLVSYFVVWRMLVVTPRRRLLEAYSTDTKQRGDNQNGAFILFKVWMVVLFVFILFVHLSFPYFITMGKTVEVSLVSYVLFACLGTSAILIAILVNIKLLEIVASILLSGVQWKWFQLNWYVIRIVVVVVIVSGLAMASLMNAAAGPVVKRVQVPVRKLPLSMNGLLIVQLSDIHLGPTVGRRQLQQSVDMTNALQPDIVVITGDLVDSTVEHLTEAVAPLKKLKAKYGAFFVTGNHEYYTHDVKNWLAHLESLGIKCLPNRNVKIADPERAQDWFYLAGTNDLQADRDMNDKEDHFSLDTALQNADSEHAVILLAHQPKAAKRAIQSEYDISLILSGHTHGGQFFPTNIIGYLTNPYYSGIYQPREGTYVYVSPGTWYNGPPMRLFSRAEITLITLLST